MVEAQRMIDGTKKVELRIPNRQVRGAEEVCDQEVVGLVLTLDLESVAFNQQLKGHRGDRKNVVWEVEVLIEGRPVPGNS